DLPINRRQDAAGAPLVTFVHTINGMTLISGGDGDDTVNVITTRQLDRTALNNALGLVSGTTTVQGGAGASEEQQVTVRGAARGVGSFTLQYRFAETKPLSVGASAEDVQAALSSLFIIGKDGVGPLAPDNVAVTKATNADGDDVYTIRFVN